MTRTRRRRSVLSQLRSDMWNGQRILGDVQAGMHGPVPYAKRRARAAGYRSGARALNRFFRKIGIL